MLLCGAAVIVAALIRRGPLPPGFPSDEPEPFNQFSEAGMEKSQQNFRQMYRDALGLDVLAEPERAEVWLYHSWYLGAERVEPGEMVRRSPVVDLDQPTAKILAGVFNQDDAYAWYSMTGCLFDPDAEIVFYRGEHKVALGLCLGCSMMHVSVDDLPQVEPDEEETGDGVIYFFPVRDAVLMFLGTRFPDDERLASHRYDNGRH